MARKTTDSKNPSKSGKPTDFSKSRNFPSDSISSAKASTSSAKTTQEPSFPHFSKLSVVPQLEPHVCPLQELVDEWIEACHSDGLSPKTIGGYADTLRKFRWWWVEYSKQVVCSLIPRP